MLLTKAVTYIIVFEELSFYRPKRTEKEKIMNKKVTSVFAYLGIIFWLIAFLAGDKEGAKFHLNQGLVLFIGGVISGVISMIPVVCTFVGCILSIAILVVAIMGINSALKDEEKPLPLIGSIQLLN